MLNRQRLHRGARDHLFGETKEGKTRKRATRTVWFNEPGWKLLVQPGSGTTRDGRPFPCLPLLSLPVPVIDAPWCKLLSVQHLLNECPFPLSPHVNLPVPEIGRPPARILALTRLAIQSLLCTTLRHIAAIRQSALKRADSFCRALRTNSSKNKEWPPAATLGRPNLAKLLNCGCSLLSWMVVPELVPL